jgi:hypothetical protein
MTEFEIPRPKFIQIAAATSKGEDFNSMEVELYALDADGGVWEFVPVYDWTPSRWERLPMPPTREKSK